VVTPPPLLQAGETALISAASFGQADVVTLLLNRNASIEAAIPVRAASLETRAHARSQ
jgi:hypothetical protein